MAQRTDGRAGTGRRRGIALPGTILGAGLGGFVDGILVHQVLQWHHMLSSTDRDNVGIPTYPVDTVHGLEINTLWDGLFHTFTWLAVLVGIGMLYSRVTGSRGRVWASRVLWGWVLVGWGVFNLVEGTLNHHVLAIHHVRSGPDELWWDLGFLGLGVVLVVVGWLVQRSGRPVDLDGGSGGGGGGRGDDGDSTGTSAGTGGAGSGGAGRPAAR